MSTSSTKSIAKRSVIIAGHKTSVSLEAPFWQVVRRMAEEAHITINVLIARIDAGRGADSLSGTIRMAALAHEQRRADSVQRVAYGATAPAPVLAVGANGSTMAAAPGDRP